MDVESQRIPQERVESRIHIHSPVFSIVVIVNHKEFLKRGLKVYLVWVGSVLISVPVEENHKEFLKRGLKAKTCCKTRKTSTKKRESQRIPQERVESSSSKYI